MSLNQSGGFTLSSFTKVKPTVSLSDATTTTTHATIAIKPASPMDTKDQLNTAKSAECAMEDLLHNELEENGRKAARFEDLNNVIAAAKAEQQNKTSKPEGLDQVERGRIKQTLDESLVDKEVNRKELEQQETPSETDILATTAVQTPSIPVIFTQPTPSEIESSEEELEVLEDFDDFRSDGAQQKDPADVQSTSIENPIIEVPKPETDSTEANNKEITHTASTFNYLGPPTMALNVSEREISDDDESIDEKMGLVSEDPPQLSPEEKLIDETLHETMEATQLKEDAELSKEIEKEVANEVHKIRAMSITDTQTIHSTESNKGKIHRISGADSIKNFANPPDNLKKQEPFDFQTFLAQFKSKDCQQVHKYLRSFLNQFNQKLWSIDEQIKLVKEFQEFLFNKLIEYRPFNEIGDDQNKINNCKEGLEKLIMTRVYSSVFSPSMSFIKLTETHKNDKIMDKKYLINCYLYDWIELKHLDLNIQIDNKHLDIATKELSHINEFKSPRDKIVCILNACKIIFNLLRQNHDTQENADSFVPLLIYVLIHSKIKNLYSNIQYIERFRNDDLLVGETSYYLSTLQISVNFIINVTKNQLTINEQEYENNMYDAKRKLRELQKGGVHDESPSQVLTKSAEMVKQSLTSSFNTLLQNIVAEDEEVDEETARDTARRSARETERAQLEEARLLSLEEQQRYAVEREQVQELENMFPNLDTTLISDVYNTCNKDAAKTVDALLSL